MKIILVRHGETQWNALGKLQGREDIPLNETGRLQAKEAGKALALYPFSGRGPVIISSPLQRAVETARLLAAELPMTAELLMTAMLGADEEMPGADEALLRTDEALLERDYGAGAGLTREERARLYPEDDFPGLEDRAAAERRIVEGVRRLALQVQERAEQPADERDLILVSHGEICHIFLAYLRGDVTHTGRSALKNASISTLTFEPTAGFQMEYYNLSAAELMQVLQHGADTDIAAKC